MPNRQATAETPPIYRDSIITYDINSSEMPDRIRISGSVGFGTAECPNCDMYYHSKSRYAYSRAADWAYDHRCAVPDPTPARPARNRPGVLRNSRLDRAINAAAALRDDFPQESSTSVSDDEATGPVLSLQEAAALAAVNRSLLQDTVFQSTISPQPF
jgi:hypothetical protein